MEDERVKISNQWLEDLSKGITSRGLEASSLAGLQILQARQGFDENGNWQPGALATLIDDVGAAAIFSLVGHIKLSLDFSISFFSPVKIHEEVEIEAKVVGEKGKLMSVVIEVRRKDSGELIALGKQWMASNSSANKPSKL